MLADLETRKASLQATLLRISGAMQVLNRATGRRGAGADRRKPN